MQKNITPCRGMHERDTVMQSGENFVVTFVCASKNVYNVLLEWQCAPLFILTFTQVFTVGVIHAQKTNNNMVILIVSLC